MKKLVPGSLEQLIFWLKIQNGTADPPKGHPKEDWSKFRGGAIKYGASVRICWNDGDPDVDMPHSDDDFGYLMGLPGFEESDPDMGGVVHVPHPSGGEKSAPDPEWITLFQLCTNLLVEFVEFGATEI